MSNCDVISENLLEMLAPIQLNGIEKGFIIHLEKTRKYLNIKLSLFLKDEIQGFLYFVVNNYVRE